MMKVFENIKAMGHEQVLFCHDPESNLKAIIAIHDTTLGPAMGATRLWLYGSEEEAFQDVLRLSRGMTYKAACANIPAGGGKAVIIASPENKTGKLLRAYGRFVDSLKGRFITGQDVNISAQDVQEISRETNYVLGVLKSSRGPVAATALGVLFGIKAAVEFRLGKKELSGIKVAVQGVGNVGQTLCRFLHKQGANLFVSDLKTDKLYEMKQRYGATIVDMDEIYLLDVDVFAPCALGGVINSSTIPLLKASIVAGSANNQLEDEERSSKLLAAKGILYCPDYVINAGGLINVYNEMIGFNKKKELSMISSINTTLIKIFEEAEKSGKSTIKVSKKLAEEQIIKAKNLTLTCNNASSSKANLSNKSNG